MTTVVQPISSDAYVVHDVPSYVSGGKSVLTVMGDGGGDARHSYIYFNRPFPLGVTVQPSYLRIHQKGAATGGSRTLTANRTAKPWKESTVAWANHPNGTGTAATVTQGNSSTNGRVWEFDITAIMQDVADGAPWYGLRIISDNDTRLTLYSSEATAFQPEVELAWSDAPQTPSVLAPSNGRSVSVARPRLRFDFTDHSGDLTMQGYRLLMNKGGPDPVSPDYDSGDVASSTPEHLVTFDIAAAEDWWWAVETIDGAGLRSALSDWVNFTRTAKPTVTIDSPAGFVSEATPPILWTVTGGTQTAYQMFITDPVDTATVLWTSGKVTSTDDSVSVPTLPVPILSPGGSYGLTVRIWDGVDRESTPGDAIYTDESTTFTFDLTSGVDPVTGLAVIVVNGEPGATATWTDPTAPDSLTIVVDGVTVASGIDPGDAFVAGTSYEWPLHVNPRTQHTVSVLRVVNGETSDDNDVESFITEPEGAWLVTADGLHRFRIGGQDPVTFAASELSVIRKPLGAVNPVIITQAVYGREGDVHGDLEPVPGQTLADAVDEWNTITDREIYSRGTPMILVGVDTAMRVFIYNPVRTYRAEFVDKVPISFSYCELR